METEEQDTHEDDLQLKTLDYVVTAFLLLVPLGIGVFFAVSDSKRSTRDEYLLGGRRLRLLPVSLSLFSTFVSAISLIGSPTEVYTYGAMVTALDIGASFSYLIGLWTMIPLVYPLQLTSVYEYLELRFESRAVRVACVVAGMFETVSYMAIALLSPGLALQAAAEIPLWVSIVIVGVIGTVYTGIGGIKSVVWSDAFQCLIMCCGLFPIIIKSCLVVGGASQVWRIAEEGGRTSFDNFNPDPRERHSWWGALIGGNFMWLVVLFNQSTVQRICSLKTMKDAKIAYVLIIPIFLVSGCLLLAAGICIYAYFFYIRCDPFDAGLITNRNQLPPYFVLHALGDVPGMGGLFMATLFSGALSTLSSGINALAANTVEDILQKPLKNVRESTATLLTKVLVFAYGILIIGFAYAAKSLKGPVTQITYSISGACGGPILGIFFLGAAIPWSNKYGALGGGALALVVDSWLALGYEMYGRDLKQLPAPSVDGCFAGGPNGSANWSSVLTHGHVVNNRSHTPSIGDHAMSLPDVFSIYDISYVWYAAIGFFVVILAGSAISYCTNKIYRHDLPDSRFIFPIVRNFWSLPQPKSDKCTREGVDHKMSRHVVSEIKKRTKISPTDSDATEQMM